jgi:dTDP-4-dehydrorhamnose reductase
MRVMVTGAGGMTGSELIRQASERGWECAAFTRSDLDISDPASVATAVSTVRPDCIINAAGYTQVDAAETNPAEAMSANATGPANLAKAARQNGATMIQISTDYVFDGAAREPYLPDAPVGPLNLYGESKLAGEIAVRDALPRHAIVRTSWVYSFEGKNFVRSMLNAGAEKEEVRVVNDQHGRPTAARDLADALLTVAAVMSERDELAGTFHFANAGATTWFDFAAAIFQLRGGKAPRLTPISTAEFPTPARRPHWSVLDTASFEKAFGVTPRSWKEALAETMTHIQ